MQPDLSAAWKPGVVVMRAADLGLWADAQAVVRHAQAKATSLIEDGHALLETQRSRGHTEGLAAAGAETAALLAELTARKHSALAEIEAALPGLVGAVLDRIFGSADRQALLQDAIRHALPEAYRGGAALFRVAPDSLDAARAALASDGRYAAITVEPTPMLPAGACRFECEYGSVELGLDAQLAALRAGIAKGWGET